jgi:hypothetical protein
LCWDDLADICSHQLNRLGAFVPDCCDQLEMDGEGLKEPATIIADSEGKSFTIIYAFHDDRQKDVITVRCRVKLARIRRPYGWETVFECPDCGRKCMRLALRRFGLQCAQCGPIVLGSNREGRVARLVRRANLISYALGMNSWVERPVDKPPRMRMKRYVRLLEQRARVLSKIGAELATRQRHYGCLPMVRSDYHSARRGGGGSMAPPPGHEGI